MQCQHWSVAFFVAKLVLPLVCPVVSVVGQVVFSALHVAGE